MALKEVSNEADYKSAISSSNLVAVHFQAPWAPECETVSAVLQELLKEAGLLGKLECFQLEAEKLAEVSLKHEIVAVPTVILFRAGKAVDRVDGVNAVELTKKDSKSCSCCSSCCSACCSQGGLGHEVETIDQCSQVHAVHEG